MDAPLSARLDPVRIGELLGVGRSERREYERAFAFEPSRPGAGG